MTDYRIEAKVRNARVLRALESIGETPSGFAKALGLNPSTMCGIAAMTVRPVYSNGDWRPETLALCEATQKLPCDLFTARQMEGVRKNAVTHDVDEQSLNLAIQTATEDLLIEDRITMRQVSKDIIEWLTEKYPRHALAVSLHFSDHTLEYIGAQLGVQRERARQILCKALSLMKRRARTKWGIEDFEYFVR